MASNADNDEVGIEERVEFPEYLLSPFEELSKDWTDDIWRK